MTSFQDSTELRLCTPLCNMFGIKYPIIQAGMAGGITSPELISAVSNAGGLGMLSAAMLSPEETGEQIRRIKSQTSRPFGVNLLLAPPEQNGHDASDVQNVLNNFRSELGLRPSDNTQINLPESRLSEQIGVILKEKVPIISFGLGNPKTFVEEIHSRGVKVIAMVTTVNEAKEVIADGADVVVAQGGEAGGHRSTFRLDENGDAQLVGTMVLVPQIVDVAGDIPIVAAGGIMDGRGIAASLALGAQGIQMGTRFLTAKESAAFPAYKKALLENTEVDTLITKVFTGRPARAVRNHFVDEFENSDIAPLAWPYQAIAAEDIYKEAVRTDNGGFFPLLAGQGLGLAKHEQGVAQIFDELVRGARQTIDRLKAETRMS